MPYDAYERSGEMLEFCHFARCVKRATDGMDFASVNGNTCVSLVQGVRRV